MKKIFIVEDDSVVKEELTKFLDCYDYTIEETDDFKNIVNIILESGSDLILLDVNLPYFDGYYICNEIRKQSSVPIIMLTSKNTDMDELMSLNLGADDFITKPYNPQILLKHIEAVLRRGSNQNNNIVSHKGLSIDVGKSIAKTEKQVLDLTKNELQILLILIRNKENIVSRDEIINELWQSSEFVDESTLTTNISRLRKKLKELGFDNYIQTKRSQGYIV